MEMDVSDIVEFPERSNEFGLDVVGFYECQLAVDLDVGFDLEIGAVVKNDQVVDARYETFSRPISTP